MQKNRATMRTIAERFMLHSITNKPKLQNRWRVETIRTAMRNESGNGWISSTKLIPAIKNQTAQ